MVLKGSGTKAELCERLEQADKTNQSMEDQPATLEGSHLVVSPQTLVFTPENWDSPQKITIENADKENPQASVDIGYSLVSNEVQYSGKVNIGIDEDDDMEAITISLENNETSVTLMDSEKYKLEYKQLLTEGRMA